MLYECHGHMLMNGASFSEARKFHKEANASRCAVSPATAPSDTANACDILNFRATAADSFDESAAGKNSSHAAASLAATPSSAQVSRLKEQLAALAAAGVTYFRDGGDNLSVSLLARGLAPAFGITFTSPAFAIHRKGRYGSIVGRAYETKDDFMALLQDVKAQQGDFIKLIISGIIPFSSYGELSCASLPPDEIRSIITLAHENGFPVMVHVNGDAAIRAAIEAGADSIEHGYFMENETLKMLAASDTMWVPTLAAVDGFLGREGFPEPIVRVTLEKQLEAIATAHALGAKIACGSDSGAVGVPHGSGTLREMQLLLSAGLSEEEIRRGSKLLSLRFRPSIDPMNL